MLVPTRVFLPSYVYDYFPFALSRIILIWLFEGRHQIGWFDAAPRGHRRTQICFCSGTQDNVGIQHFPSLGRLVRPPHSIFDAVEIPKARTTPRIKTSNFDGDLHLRMIMPLLHFMGICATLEHLSNTSCGSTRISRMGRSISEASEVHNTVCSILEQPRLSHLSVFAS